MRKERPVYLSLTQFSFPVTAISSILHRMTGVMLFAGIAYLLWMLGLALESPQGLAEAAGMLSQLFPKLVLWGVLVMLTFHIIAGIKHMFLDFHIGDTFEAASVSAYVVFAATVVVAAALGVWLW